MKKRQNNIDAYRMRIFAIMAIAAIMGFSMAGCESPTDGESVLSGTVTITGTAATGQTLTADTAALKGKGTIDYQWKRGGVNIGENSSTYVVQVEDIGSTITVTVTRTGSSGSVTSEPTAAVIDARPALSGTVIITGDAEVGETLTADTTGLGGEGTITYQWKRNSAEGGATVIGTNLSTYEVQPADDGYTITVTVTRSGNSGSVTSEPTETVVDLRPELTGTVVITGTAQLGQTLTAVVSDLGGEGAITYQWHRNPLEGGPTNIGTNSDTYMVQEADIDYTITVTITRRDRSSSITSEPTATVTDFRPDLTGTVSITGTAATGRTLTADTANLGGEGAITYQWKRGSNNIGTNSETYTVQAADVGSTITVTVSRAGYSGSKISAPTATVTESGPPESIRATTTKNWYVVGDTGLDLSTITVEAVYSNGDSEFISNSMVTFGTLNTSSAGGRNISVSYGGHSTTFSVTVYALTKIEVAVPTPIRFAVGESLDSRVLAITVTATYGNNQTENVTGRIILTDISGFSSTTAGNKELTVTYRTASATFTVSVVGVSSITVTSPTKVRYAIGESLNIAGIGVTAHYTGLDSRNVSDQITIANTSGFSSTTATASRTVTVTYGGQNATFTVSVYATVTFNPNGGNWSGSTTSQTVETEGAAVTAPATNPTRATYVFDGWYTAATGGTPVNFATLITGNTAYYAQWVSGYTVTFNPNGGNWNNNTANKTETVRANTAVTPPVDPTRAAYVFDGWYTAATGGTLVNFATPITGNTTYYAQWTPAYTITFNPNGGNWDGNTANLDVGAKQGTAVARPDDPSKLRRSFGGWYTTAQPAVGGTGTAYNFATLVTGPITLYARWNYALPLTDVNDVAPYLGTLTGGTTVAAPVSLPVQFDLGTMTQAGSGWRQLLTALNTAGKFVNLDLSLCTMTGTEFNPDMTVETGKDRIVTIALPNMADSIAGGLLQIGGVGDYYGAFVYFHTNLKSFSGTGLKTIGNNAFMNCTGLTMSTLPAGITSIGSGAFNGCTGLTMTTLPAGITSIGSGAFNGCTNLALTTLPANLISIGDQAFYNCGNITLTALPANLTSIGDTYGGAFFGCTKITLTALPSGVTAIPSETFRGCSGITQISLPGVTSIGNSAFLNCTNLVRVTFGGTITEANFGTGTFTGDLRAKYLAANGGAGTYTRPNTSTNTWTKL